MSVGVSERGRMRGSRLEQRGVRRDGEEGQWVHISAKTPEGGATQ